MENGSPVCTHRNHKYDSSCMTQCDRGYGLSSGIIFSTCQEDKTWSTDLPDCEGNLSLVLPKCYIVFLHFMCLSLFTYVFLRFTLHSVNFLSMRVREFIFFTERQSQLRFAILASINESI